MPGKDDVRLAELTKELGSRRIARKVMEIQAYRGELYEDGQKRKQKGDEEGYHTRTVEVKVINTVLNILYKK